MSHAPEEGLSVSVIYNEGCILLPYIFGRSEGVLREGLRCIPPLSSGAQAARGDIGTLDTGMMGGDIAHEYMLLPMRAKIQLFYVKIADTKRIWRSPYPDPLPPEDTEQPLEEVYYTHIQDIESLAAFLNIAPDKTMKAYCFLC